MATQFLGLEDAATLDTPSYMLGYEAIDYAARRQAMVALHGPAGTGKSFAVDEALERGSSGIETHILKFPNRASRASVVRQLLAVLTGLEQTGDTWMLIEEAHRVLAEKPRVLVVDEAQELTWDAVEFLRHLWDDRHAQFGVAFVGAEGCWELIASYQPLESRVSRDVQFVGLNRSEVRKLIPAYHPLYENTEPALIDYVDESFAKGNLRSWARFTVDAVDICEQTGTPGVTMDIATEVFLRQRGPNATNPVAKRGRGARNGRYRRKVV